MKINSKDTPMIKQWKKIKSHYENELIFYRLGDFYELFFDDAKKAARLLNITLTKKKSKEQEVPMAGIPYHSAKVYIKRLLSYGESIVICEQQGNPNEQKLMERKVERILTPGTVIEEDFLDSNINNILTGLSFNFKINKVGISNIDISTGYFECYEVTIDKLNSELSRINTNEIIIRYDYKDKISNLHYLNDYKINYIRPLYTDYESSIEDLKYHFDIQNLLSFNIIDLKEGVKASQFILNYCKEKQNSHLPNIKKIERYIEEKHVFLDNNTRKNLEINHNINGEYSPSLLSTINFTKTNMGNRKLRQWLNNPIRDKVKIEDRLEAVQEINNKGNYFEDILEYIDDIERMINRISLFSASPKDVLKINEFLSYIPQIKKYNKNYNSNIFKNFQFHELEEIKDLIERSINKNSPTFLKDGDVIKDGFDSELDEYRNLINNSSDILFDIEEKEKEKTNIEKLKIGFNKISGYYIEIPKNKIKDNIPKNYILKQSLKNIERYTTEEIKLQEEKMLSAKSMIINIEKKLFNEIQGIITQYKDTIIENCNNISIIDVLCNFSFISKKYNLTKPIIKNDFFIKNGRHLVIENIQKHFTANNFHLNDNNKTVIITGANMGGKSTYMRQNAIITLLSHIGSFVPAEYCEVPLIDKLFTRIGASDNLAHGLSTFMVEMSETATILNYATDNSLVLFDEIGRGTSTYDGLSLAWAIAKTITEKNKSYTMFSTHYSELNELSEINDNIYNVYLKINITNEDLEFTHKVYSGFSNKSYGIEVAEKAGISKDVILEAKVKNNSFISTENNINTVNLDSLDLDSISPKEAWEFLYKLKNKN
tara:strand:- start:12469 stop:14952 length:2484 start_codon:yes stop_codon:yes gene_type:complete